MIHVTHDPVEAVILADRVVVLDGGVVQQVDRPLEVYHRPSNRRVAGFFGWPPMNFIDGVLKSTPDGMAVKVGETALAVPPLQAKSWAAFADRQVSVGMRPPDVRLATVNDQATSDGWTGKVTLVEALGSLTLASVQLGEWMITGQANGQPPSEGQAMTVMIDWQKAHLFDRATGQALAHGRPEG